MIRKISIQDVVNKNTSTKSGRSDSDENVVDPRKRERDFLIERLNRKNTSLSIVESAKSKTRSHHNKPNSNKKFNKWLWFGVPALLIVILFVVLMFMVSAELIVKPKQVSVEIDTKLLATLSATSAVNSTSTKAIMYQVINLSASDSEVVEATGTVATKPQKATGKITIFNNFSSAPQTLVTNTRFETESGLIYRIQKTIQVPGITTVDGKKVPGNLTVDVVADQVGDKYNIDLSDFTIPGFKNDPGRYEKIFARSKTTMTGGSNGNTFGVSEEARKTAVNKIQQRLRENLIRQAQSQKTADSVIFENASKISFQHLSDTASADGKLVTINEQGTISSVAFDKKSLGKALLSEAIAGVGGNAEISGMEKLHFIAAVSSTSPIWQAKPFNFTLTGTVKVRGVVDSTKLLQDVRGLPQSQLTEILSKYPTIDRVNVIIKPFWKRTFPSDPTKIKVKIVTEQ